VAVPSLTRKSVPLEHRTEYIAPRRIDPLRYAIWVAFLLGLVFLFQGLSLAPNSHLDELWITSDTLYPVHLWTDTVVDGYSFWGWKFSIAPCWFPDLLLTALSYIITQNVIGATLLAGFVQIPLLIGAAHVLRRSVIGSRAVLLHDLFTFGAGTAFAVYLGLHTATRYPGLYQFFLPQTHIGSLILVLWGAATSVYYLRGALDGAPVRKWLIAYALISFAAGFSNILYFVQWVAPLTAALAVAVFFDFVRLKSAAIVTAAGWACGLVGAVINRFAMNTSPVGMQSVIGYERGMEALDTFLRGAIDKLSQRDIMHSMAVLWILFCAICALTILRSQVVRGTAGVSPSRRIAFILCTAFLGASLLSPAVIIVGGSETLTVYKDYVWSLHYMHPTFLIPLLGLPMVAAWLAPVRLQHSRALIATAAIVLAAVPATLLIKNGWPPHGVQSYRPGLVEVMDDAAKQHNLKTGVAGYWQARLITLLSRTGLRAYAVDGQMIPLMWVSNAQWYSELYSSTAKKTDFVVLDDSRWHLKREDAVRVFGEPKTELNYEGVRILLYK
jgi:hypothetical protein